MKKRMITNLAAVIILLTSGCIPFSRTQDANMPTGNVEATFAAETIQVYQTEFAQFTQEAMAAETQTNTRTVAPSETPLPPTETLIIPTHTTAPSSTPLPTPTPILSPSATPAPCNWISFIDDITIPDGSKFTGKDRFLKTWRLKNIGSCDWTTDYDLVFHSGDRMDGPAAVDLKTTVKPGQTVDVSVNLIAPNEVGKFTGYWKLRSGDGLVFGLGANANNPFWVAIEVTSPAPTPDPNKPLDFAKFYCSAKWSSPTQSSLPCPALEEDFSNGSIMRNPAPKIEETYQDDEVALVMVPSNGTGGLISGRYPAVNVKSGDRFIALTGCMSASPKCSVTFRLNYIAGGGPVQNLKTWTEVFDGKRTHVSIDLSALDGQSVEFILEVENNDNSSEDDRAFWLVPVIER